MLPHAALIQQPAIDFPSFLAACHEMLGYSPSRAADASRTRMSDSERFLSCLAAIRDQEAPTGVTPSLLAHVSFSVLIAAEERDLIDILSIAGSMPFVASETVARDVFAAVVTGTLGQWRDAVVSGTNLHEDNNVRTCYCKVLLLFESVGLNRVWSDFTKKPGTDRLFYLEDKRK